MSPSSCFLHCPLIEGERRRTLSSFPFGDGKWDSKMGERGEWGHGACVMGTLAGLSLNHKENKVDGANGQARKSTWPTVLIRAVDYILW